MAKIMAIVGVLLMIGTVGALECDTIRMVQAVIQIVVGLGLIAPCMIKREVQL